MKKRLLKFQLLLIALLISLTGCGKSKSAAVEDSTMGNTSDEPITEVIEEDLPAEQPFDTIQFKNHVSKTLFFIIPDHRIENVEKLKKHATPELSSLLIEAFDVPAMYPGLIGDEEFLYYFVTGNGGDEDGNAPVIIKSFDIDGDKATVNVTWNGIKHKLSLVKDNNTGEWVLADFDGQKKEVIKFLKTARKYFESGEYLNDEYGDDEWRESVRTYLRKYPKR